MVAAVLIQVSKLPPRLLAVSASNPKSLALGAIFSRLPRVTPSRITSHLFLSPLCFHNLTNPCSRNCFRFTSVQIPRGVGVKKHKVPTFFSVHFVPLWQIHLFQKLAASLSSLCALFRTRFLCLQSFAASFPKHPGGGQRTEPPQAFLCVLGGSVANPLRQEVST